MVTVPLVGKSEALDSIADRITHIAIGTNDTPYSDSSVQLNAEYYRITPTVKIVTDNNLVVETLFVEAVLPDQVEELTIILDGSGDVNSGTPLIIWPFSYTSTSGDLIVILSIDLD